jgi:hypothetical protein
MFDKISIQHQGRIHLFEHIKFQAIQRWNHVNIFKNKKGYGHLKF